MKPFLDKIADRLLKKFPENMQKVLVILPSKRAVLFLKKYLSEKIKKPTFLPEFYSIEEFIEHVSGLQILDNISLQFRLYKAYCKNPPMKIDSFDDFLSWSNILLNDFNEIDKSLVDPKLIYTNLRNMKDLENWSLDNWSFQLDNLTDLQSQYISFFENMYVWYRNFKEDLLLDNLAYQGLAYRIAVSKIKSCSLDWDKVWFVGLNALTKSEQEIINYLKEEDIARVFWDADTFYYDNKIHEAGGFLRTQRDKWKEIDFQGVGDYYSQGKDSFNIIASPKSVSQAKVASEIIKNLKKEDLENSNTAVVLADETLLLTVLNNLPKEVKELNVTMGSPLTHTILFTFIQEIFKMQVNASKYQQEGFYYKDIISLIGHPYFIRLLEDNTLTNIKEYINKNNVIFISSKDMIRLFFEKDKLALFFHLWKHSSDVIFTLKEIIRLLAESIKGSRGSIFSESLTIFSKCILRLEKLIIELDVDLQIKTLQTVMDQLVSKEIIPFQGEPLKGLQVMGILETRTLDFKNIIMLSVNEGVLPKGKSANSFIPYDMKRYFKLPTYSEKDAVFAYHFYRLLQRAKNISLIYNSETDEFGSGEKSRFITQLLSEYKSSKIDSFIYTSKNFDFIQTNKIIIKNNLVKKEIHDWAKKGVSPSAINKYNSCSLAFYYHYLVKIRSHNIVDEHADASTIGDAIHFSLQEHYPLGLLTENFLKDNRSKIINSLTTNFQELISKDGIKRGKNYLSLEIAKKLIKDFLNSEISFLESLEKNNNTIEILEKEKELFYSLTVEDIDFYLTGKIDRVDLIGDNQLRIIDYKTGRVEKSELIFSNYDELINDINKSKAFQLIMYSYLYLQLNSSYSSKEVVAGNFSLRKTRDDLIMVSKKDDNRNKKVLNINQQVLSQFEGQLKIILSRIVNNDFVQTDNTSICKWCDYRMICKR